VTAHEQGDSHSPIILVGAGPGTRRGGGRGGRGPHGVFLNEGRVTAAFTERVAAALGVKHVQATCNGTTALYVALKACGVGPGDEVIVPDLTFMATANAVALCAATPVLVDICPHNLNLDPASVEVAITRRTRAIVPVHVNGRAADVAALGALARAHGLAVIEDAAQALGSRHQGRALGTWGALGCVSLAPTKIITSGQGGLVLTDRDDLRDAVVRLKDHGRLARSWNNHPQVGFNFKYSDLQAAIANAQFDRLGRRLEVARQQYRHYATALAGLPGITFLDTDIEGGTVPLWVDALVEDAHGLVRFLEERRLTCRPFWPAIHAQPCYARPGAFPHASYAAAHGVWFPSGVNKSADEIDEVIGAVREFLVRRR
jgi:perosamine synthetase